MPAPPPGATVVDGSGIDGAVAGVDDADFIAGAAGAAGVAGIVVFAGMGALAGALFVDMPGSEGAVDEALTPYQSLTPLWPRQAPFFVAPE